MCHCVRVHYRYCNSHLQVLGILPKTRKKRQGEQDISQPVSGSAKVKKLLVPGLSDGSAHIGALKPQSVGSKKSKLICTDVVPNDLSQLLTQPSMNDLRTRLQEEREAVGEKDLLPLGTLIKFESGILSAFLFFFSISCFSINIVATVERVG